MSPCVIDSHGYPPGDLFALTFMPGMTSMVRVRPMWAGLILGVAVAAVAAIPIGADTVGSLFLASLRLEKPAAAAATAPAANAAGSRQLLNVVAGILAESSTVVLNEADVPMPTVDSASHAAGFPAHLVGVRADVPTVELLGGRQVAFQLNRGQLQTLLTEAARPAAVPVSVDGASVTLGRPRGLRAEYGRCPVPTPNTIQGQINGPPPASSDNGNCVILTEIPFATLKVPGELDTASVLEIALELTGMSPNQARDFRGLFGWRGALALSAPRTMRSYEIKSAGGSPAILMLGGGRREPAYVLAWIRDGMVYSLAGYGSSADAVPLATSVR